MTTEGTLFESSTPPPGAPLAARMRPRSIDELIGQQQLVMPGTPLFRLLTGDLSSAISIILWGPPGTGKTTLARVISQVIGQRFVELSAVTAGVKEVRAVVDRARNDVAMYDRRTVLFVDEVHRFSKTQQDSLLPAVENGWVTLIAATTENPSFSIVSPLLSRSVIAPLQSLNADDIGTVLDRALADDRGYSGRYELADEARHHLIRLAAGDARRALTALEAAAGCLDPDDPVITLAAVEQAVSTNAVRYDRAGDQHYDVISAFIKSIRGSDVDAALHYLARMLTAGEDPRFIARRLVILASEDIGLADQSALLTAVAAAQAVALIGLPEARLTLAQATIHLSLAPKSAAVTQALEAALLDIDGGLGGSVPAALRDGHYSGAADLGHGAGYRYPHDYPEGVVSQQYAPEELHGRRYYHATQHGAEARWADIHQRLRKALGSDDE
ncbi:MAG: replication-associated recombination protein A [Candidatus Nanopelagicales bacterium]